MQRCNFYVLATNHITTKLTSQNHDQRPKYHHLMTTLHLTLKMTTVQVVEMSVTNNSLSEDCHHPDQRSHKTKNYAHCSLHSIPRRFDWNRCRVTRAGLRLCLRYAGFTKNCGDSVSVAERLHYSRSRKTESL